MVSKDDYIAWRNLDVTKEFLRDISDSSANIVSEVMNRILSDVPRDQYLKGFLGGLSVLAGWVPQFAPMEDEEDD